ncbi:Dam family site-specific DNA-(adenine-N6)-methyltransferase [Clostridiaceae bacterium HSG29]|nr:Dam family site-specific DNA-(adenine-N6)-methyltransferase [Clostridiaceae bacterium HSG29]
MRYIGSKVNLLEEIENIISIKVNDDSEIFCDIFSGTGTVGAYFKKDYSIKSNDILYFSHIIQKARIELNHIPEFKELKKHGIIEPLDYLETAEYEVKDSYFITMNYSPYKENNRMYFTVENAGRIDFIRQTIEQWKKFELINEEEHIYLLAVLIESIPYVSNISGTYGAYLKHWDKRALKPIKLNTIAIVNNTKKNKSFNADSNKIISELNGDILYIDPPYNGRQYITNYHVLETIARYDSPSIYGITGLRPYDKEKSKYCLKREVKSAFEDLIRKAQFKHLIISYSSDGLLSEEYIQEILIKYGIKETYDLKKIPYRKYKSKHKQENNILYEYLFYIQKNFGISTTKKHKKIKIENEIYNTKYVKSPLNYIGGKFKLLKQILPLFPNDIDKFVDLFAGGFNVGVNVKSNIIYCNDINNYVIDIIKTFNRNDIEDTVNHINNKITDYKLSKTNDEAFKTFRQFYNESDKCPLDLYTLVCYSFNYQFRFNNNHQYNNPFGRNRSHFSKELEKKLRHFVKSIQSKNIVFSNSEFELFNFADLNQNDLVYCDPPYLITTGSYNDGNRGFKDWNISQEHKLLCLLDALNDRGIRFALSNVLEHKDKKNELLIEWSKKYNVHYLNYNYSNSSHNTKKGKSIEVLITNY